MKILCTGVAGFIGSHLAEQLADLGHEVIGVDNLSVGVRENIPKNIEFTRLDLCHAGHTKTVIEYYKPEIIFHLAAWAHEGLSQFMPRLITENNLNAYLNLLIPAINNGMRRMVLFSSMSVYGSQIPPFTEDMETKPEDIYAVAKSAMEKTTEVLSDVHGFEYVIIRPHNVYGERQMLHDPYRNVIGIMINRLMKGLPPIIYGNGTQTRAFSYIDDVVPYVLRAGLTDWYNKEIFNIGPLEEYSINRLTDIILDAFSSPLTPIYFPDRPREVRDAFSSNDKAIQLLGYQTSVTLEQGIGKMVEWAKSKGPKDFHYLEELELSGDKLPKTWKEKLI